MEVWPVPAVNEITVGSQQSAVGSQMMNCRIEICTLAGQVVLSKLWTSTANELTLDVSDLPCGSYILVMKTNEGESSGRVISIAR
jgi:hypothetical protein